MDKCMFASSLFLFVTMYSKQRELRLYYYDILTSSFKTNTNHNTK